MNKLAQLCIAVASMVIGWKLTATGLGNMFEPNNHRNAVTFFTGVTLFWFGVMWLVVLAVMFIAKMLHSKRF